MLPRSRAILVRVAYMHSPNSDSRYARSCPCPSFGKAYHATYCLINFNIVGSMISREGTHCLCGVLHAAARVPPCIVREMGAYSKYVLTTYCVFFYYSTPLRQP